MILRHLKSVAADSNVLLSAVIGKAALKIFTHTGLKVLTTVSNILEIQEYLPSLGAKYHIDTNHLWLQFKMLPLHIVNVSEYKHKLSLAKERIGGRDLDDVHLVALALAQGIAIWSNDRDFEVLPGVDIYPTAKLLKLFNL